MTNGKLYIPSFELGLASKKERPLKTSTKRNSVPPSDIEPLKRNRFHELTELFIRPHGNIHESDAVKNL
jgi:hypothetical protein